MKRTEEQLISLIQEHGFATVARKYKHHHSSSDLKQICYRHQIGDLPPYQYPHILREELSQGYNPVQIAEKYGTSFTTIYRFMRKYKISPKIRVFTEEEDKYIRFNIGYISVSEIADTLRRPVPSIYHRMQTLRLSMQRAIGYTVQQLSADIGVPVATIRNWIAKMGLKAAPVTGTYRIGIDETMLHEWLLSGNVYRINPLPVNNHYLMDIIRECDEKYVSSMEIERITGKWVINPKKGWPEKVLTVHEGYGALYLRSDVYRFFWERRRLLDRETIPDDLPYWKDLCSEWDSQYIYREEIALYVDYACSGPWFAYETKYHGFPLPADDSWIKFYSRSAVLRWSRASGKHPRLVRHLEQTTY